MYQLFSASFWPTIEPSGNIRNRTTKAEPSSMKRPAWPVNGSTSTTSSPGAPIITATRPLGPAATSTLAPNSG